MHPQFTTIYLVGRGQVLTIDSGEDLDRYRWMLRGYLAATEKAEIALAAVTHHHADHSGNLRWLRDLFGAEVFVLKEARPFLAARLPETGVREVEDGAAIDVGAGVSVRVVHTPGHSPDSVCYFLEEDGVLFTGDTVLGSTTTTVSDLGAYMASLRRIRSLPNLRIICPGHGPLIYDPYQRIDSYLAHREQRERQILELLRAEPELTSWQIMERIYIGIDPRLRRPAEGNVRTHLRKLEAEGRVQALDGVRRQPSADELARAQAEEAERQAIMRKADEYREQARRRALLLEENPPLDEWEEPPRYRLV